MASDKHSIWLISGIPATRKSTFGKWLQKNHRFLHLDLEHDKDRPPRSLKGLWSRKFFTISSPEAAQSFIQDLKSLARPIAIDWGFPPEFLWAIEGFKQSGVLIWWFDGDPAAARNAFEQRGATPIECFDVQMNKIRRNLVNIQRLFESNSTVVLNSEGMYLRPEAIYDLIKSRRD
jgi:hypothetical protein